MNSILRNAAGLWILLLFAGGYAAAQQEEQLLDLRGLWRFEIGDDMQWASPKFDDSRWAKVQVPATWEDEGFPGYDGYAWYRIRFNAPSDWQDRLISLKLGYIDDVDEVFVNGKFVAFNGSFPPGYNTAYGTPRSYFLPPGVLNYGAENLIAVRVYDQQLGGGIVRGRVGIYEVLDPLRADQPLAGPWRFAPGDDPRRSAPKFDDSGWRRVEVPAFWETQGFKGFDGFGWYRTSFTIDAGLADRRPILLLGMIDDMDETYVDGERIGRTGSFAEGQPAHGRGDEYLVLRAYTLPAHIVQKGGTHSLAIRVYDTQLHGGIYAGPVGLIARDRFVEWQRREEKSDNWIKRLFDSFKR